MFFDSFLSGFESLRVDGHTASFTSMQMEMLDQLIAGNHFQVSSTDMNCGSGKTTLAVGATLGLLCPGDKLIVVYRPAKTTSPLMSQIAALTDRFSGGRALVGTTGVKGTSVQDVVALNDVVITPCTFLESVMKAAVDIHRATASFTSTSPRRSKIYVIFDESHQIFPSVPLYVVSDSARCRELFPYLPLSSNIREQDKYNKWINLNSIKSVGRRMSQRAAQVDAVTSQHAFSCPEEINIDVRGLVAGIVCMQSFVLKALSHLQLNPRPPYMPSFQCIFLSAGGEFHAGARMVSSASVIESLFHRWFTINVSKVISEGANVDSYRYTKVFRIFSSGAEQIGGVTEFGRPKVYEAMLSIAFNLMVKGRLLFIVRRQQVDAFSSLLDDHIAKAGQYYTYTSDKEYWNALDSDGKPLFNIILVREDELQDLEGVNIEGIKAVYLFSVGRVQDLLQKMQGIGRVGRVGQGRTYTFIMVDCATRGNAKKEHITEDVMLEALGTNSVCKPHVVDVTGSRVLYDKITDIPLYDPPVIPPSASQLEDIKTNIRMANKKQVCKYIRCDGSGRHQCINLACGYKCAWYHPKDTDFVKHMMLDGNKFNIRYCQRGVFAISKPVVAARRGILPSTVAPWAAEVMGDNSVQSSEQINSALYEAFFPKLGETASIAPSLVPAITSLNKSSSTMPPKPIVQLPSSPRQRSHSTARPLARPVCLFAVLGKSKCKYSRTGRKCPFRHPELKADNVTEEEFKEAVIQAKANISRRITGRTFPATNGYSAVTPERKIVTATSKSKEHTPVSSAQTPVAKPTVVAAVSVKPVCAPAASESTRMCDGWNTVRARKGRPSIVVSTSIMAADEVLPIQQRGGASNGTSHSAANKYASLDVEEDIVSEGVGSNGIVVTSPPPLSNAPPPAPVVSAATLAIEAEAHRKEETASLAMAARKMAQALLLSGDFGEDLLDRVTELGAKVASVHFVREFVCLVLSIGYSSSPINYSWCDDSSYGPTLSYLADIPVVGCRTAVLYGVQQFCNSLDFPKCDTSAGKRSLLDLHFRLLYMKGILSSATFLAWADDDSELYLGKMTAVVHSSEFINFLRDEEFGLEQSDDEWEDKERTKQYSTGLISVTEKSLCGEEASKQDRQQQKRERRAERVAQREGLHSTQ